MQTHIPTDKNELRYDRKYKSNEGLLEINAIANAGMHER
jgi:hypothetical protein